MLQHLHIENYVLISRLDISFPAGFSVLTGETGAGKSIILGALGLIMGERADIGSITEGEKKCVVEAEFQLTPEEQSRLADFFEANDLDFAADCLIRRELNSNGKSRAFINDSPVSLSLLRELTGSLIDIHSQHANLLLRSDSFQLQTVDIVAQNQTERTRYREAYERYKATEKQLQQLQQKAGQLQADADYIEFQYNQLSSARLKENEEEELNQTLQLLTHAEEVKTALTETGMLLSAEQAGAESNLREALTRLRRIEKYLPSAENNIAGRLESVYIELKDIAAEANAIADETDFNPEQLREAEDRLNLIYSLMQKHHCQTTTELIALCADFEKQLHQTENLDEEIDRLKKQLLTDTETLKKEAGRLTETRQQAGSRIAPLLENQLALLGIPHARIVISITPANDYTASGADQIQFMFAANKNQQLRPVTEVASGGEMSRLMLTLKSLTAEEQGLPTIIFDEIDTGVSGEVANNIGTLLQHIASGRQIITITHLPQIAAKGTTHYKVFKQDSDLRTETHIKQLTKEERLTEIATLLSGNNITPAALSNAQELLMH